MSEEKIFVNISAKNLEDLKVKYPAVNIDDYIERKVKYFREKPFKSKEKLIWNDKIKEYICFVNEDFKEEVKQIRKEEAFKVFGLKRQTEEFNKITPLFFDKSGMFWLWNNQDKYWEIVDEIDILNMINEATGDDIISSQNRTEIINSLKQKGRLNIPEPIKPTWIQFKNKIYDIETGERFDASSKYFVTNPIPWDVGESPETPTIDKIFKEWVGEKYVPLLYEIIAYSILPDYPINRLFCLIGSGLNGKSKFLELLKKFVGIQNVCSTELDILMASRFEVTRLHKKLVCLMGETNFEEMSKTSILKKLTGKDVIGFEYKNKNPFEDYNYAKIILATNNLPTTTDKTIGFYRRWCIIDFPNTFSEAKDILKDIPEEEYNNLAYNSIVTLNKLLKAREFTNEGTIEERAKKYEDKSDPLEKFIKEYTEEDENGSIWKFQFEKQLNEWCTENRFRKMSDVVIGKKMKEKGINQGQKQSEWLIDGKYKLLRAWEGIKWKGGNSQE
jgi:P4 family phage/plasmid primase-like protien